MQDCAAILGTVEPTVIPHVPLPSSEYATSTQAGSESTQLPAEWYEDLASTTRRGTKFMQKALALRLQGRLSESVVEQTIDKYLQFMRDLADDPWTKMRVPSDLVDLVSVMDLS